ncbi:protein of unknown function [Methylorubrum extorquens]|uniref:Uncharacterized protein n=1 Tax=Methylorubrum extorquens TaxID=408 RepID=A0A2N9ASV8_METEX|nr:protein of unknown function [Methylorubrum extorquens]
MVVRAPERAAAQGRKWGRTVQTRVFRHAMAEETQLGQRDDFISRPHNLRHRSMGAAL